MKKNIIFLCWLVIAGIITMQACHSGDEIRQTRYYMNGKKVYEQQCSNCHGMKGEGLAALYPSLTGTRYIKEKPSQLACIIRFGIQDTTESHNSLRYAMPAHTSLAPIDIAYLINYIGNSFGNQSKFYSQEQVQRDLRQCQQPTNRQ